MRLCSQQLTPSGWLPSACGVWQEPVHGLRRVPLLRDVGMYLCIVTSTLAICADGVSTAEAASCLWVQLLSTEHRGMCADMWEWWQYCVCR